MKVFLIVFGIIIAYIFIGVLCYYTSILICYKNQKTKNSLNYYITVVAVMMMVGVVAYAKSMKIEGKASEYSKM